MTNEIPGMKFFDRSKGDQLTESDLKKYVYEVRQLCKVFPDQIEKMRSVLDRNYAQIYAIGIGDSLYSAESVKLGFWEDSGIQMQVLESQEFNNYYIDYMPENSLVIVCSGGGSAARTVETSYLAQSRGAEVVALTLSPESRLTASAKNVLCYSTDKDSFIDGSRNYMSLAFLVKLVGLRMGVWQGVLSADEEKARIEKLVHAAEVGFEAVLVNEPKMKELMFAAREQKKFYFFGAGPGLILADYGGAKFMEETAADGIRQQLEEYGHEQYWVHNRRPDGCVLFSICPDGKSVQRCAENIEEQNFLDLVTVVLTTSPVPQPLKDKAKYTFATTEPVDENDFWLVAGNIFARLADFYAEYIGYSMYRFQNRDQFVEHYKTIHYSRFCPEVAQFDIPIPSDETIAEKGAFGLQFKA